jgi:Protein of unknown function (DUF1552)
MIVNNVMTRKILPRRTVLRGLGATIALPLLDAMVPALTAQSATSANAVRCLSLIYIGNGVAPGYWTPRGEGRAFEMSPILEPLESIRDHLVVLSGLDNKPGLALVGEPTGGHGRVAPAFLSGVHAKPTEGADFKAATTIDQVAATQLRGVTELPSLELCLESPELAGSCDVGFSCAYTNTICWTGPTTPLPMENNPRAVFERLFGDTGSTNPALRLERLHERRSILDSLRQRVSRLQQKLGPRDRSKMTEYLEAIRDVERRIETAEAQSARELPVVDQPAGVPPTFAEHAKLMFDLQVLAYQCDLTRVITFMMVREISNRSYPEVGVSDAHHALSHHGEVPEKIARLAKINHYHTQMLAYYLEKLRSTPDGDGNLLDHVMVLYGGGMYNSNQHDTHNLPLLLAGGGVGRLEGGRHIRFKEGTPLTNLHLTLLGKLGVMAERVGDSSGELTEI